MMTPEGIPRWLALTPYPFTLQDSLNIHGEVMTEVPWRCGSCGNPGLGLLQQLRFVVPQRRDRKNDSSLRFYFSIFFWVVLLNMDTNDAFKQGTWRFDLKHQVLSSKKCWTITASLFETTREWMVPNPQKTEKQNYPRAQAWQAWQWELLDFREVHIAGWWFGTFFIFPFSGEFHHPNWLIFFRGVGLNHQPDSHVAQYALKCTDHCVRNGPSKVFLIVVLCSVTWRDVAVAGRVTPKEW